MGIFRINRQQDENDQAALDIINAAALDKRRSEERPSERPKSELSSAPVPPTPSRSRQAYGIEQVIELFAKLPRDNPELVFKVVVTTMENLNVSVAAIIEDANNKESLWTHKMGQLEKEIAKMQESIASKVGEIGAINSALALVRDARMCLSVPAEEGPSGQLGALQAPMAINSQRLDGES